MKLSNRELLFVYGTLRREADNRMQRYLSQKARFLGEGLFQGKLFYAEGHPAARPSSSESDTVIGDLFDIRDSPKLLHTLDNYEGYDADNPGKSLYTRELVNIKPVSGESVVQAWIYLYNKPVSAEQKIDSGDYLQFQK